MIKTKIVADRRRLIQFTDNAGTLRIFNNSVAFNTANIGPCKRRDMFMLSYLRFLYND